MKTASPERDGASSLGLSARRLNRTQLVSPKVRQTIRTRLAGLAGWLLAVTSVLLFGALLSYSPRDPSFDTAAAGPIFNLAGMAGASIADVLIQAFGSLSLLLPVTMLIWAWRFAAGRHHGSLAARLLCLIAAVLLLAPGFASLALALHAGAAWGGAVGSLIASPVLTAARRVLPEDQGFLGAAPCLLAGVLWLWAAFGLSVSDLRHAGNGLGLSSAKFRRVRSGTVDAAGTITGLFHRHVGARLAAQFDDNRGLELPPPMSDGDEGSEAAPMARPQQPEQAQGKTRLQNKPNTPSAGNSDKPTSNARVIPRAVFPAMERQGTLELPDIGWAAPPLSLLKPPPSRAAEGPNAGALQGNARLLETVLADYGVQGAIRDIHPGPVVTLYELEPAPGIRAARVIGLADDIARSLSVSAVRIATVSGRNVIGIEVPNARRETVFLSEIIGSAAFRARNGKLMLALGKDIGGQPQMADLARMPHLLIAGTTGSGKSVGINAMILSLLYQLSPEQCKLILIDPKMLELSVYEGIPHLMAPVVTEPAKAVTALKWTVREMERRYRNMTGLGVRNIDGYNDRIAEARTKGEVIARRVQTGFDPETNKPIFEEQTLVLQPMPLIVVVIDEMADLMMVAGKEIEAAVQRLAQMARAAGIHVIMATQRPSVDVITGTIKANFPTRISFQVISKFDSRTILGDQGAEQLLGMGDMLFMAGGGRVSRVHGPFVSDREVEDVVAYLHCQGEPEYIDDITDANSEDVSSVQPQMIFATTPGPQTDQSLYDQAVMIVTREGKASTSFVQRHLAIGYNKAAKLIEQMERDGVITEADHVGRREILRRASFDSE